MAARSPSVAFFVSPHGYGHAARSAAVMAAVSERLPGTRLELFTTVPGWFFAESLATPFSLHPLTTDIGLVQRDALTIDFEETVTRLSRFIPFTAATLDPLARDLEALGCRAVVCDISPLGLAVARRAGIPAVLVENFTWDWVYGLTAGDRPALTRFADMLGALFAATDLHVQVTPVCRPREGARVTRPVSRRPRTIPAETRARLGVAQSAPMVLVTMGGIPWPHLGLETLEHHGRATFVVPGAGDRPERRGHLLALPHHSPFFHPDLVAASDVVIGKLGYSTVAEVYAAGCAFGFVPRADFPESPVLAEFCRTSLPSRPLAADALSRHGWLTDLDELLEQPRNPPGRADGAEQVAELLVGLVG